MSKSPLEQTLSLLKQVEKILGNECDTAWSSEVEDAYCVLVNKTIPSVELAMNVEKPGKDWYSIHTGQESAHWKFI